MMDESDYDSSDINDAIQEDQDMIQDDPMYQHEDGTDVEGVDPGMNNPLVDPTGVRGLEMADALYTNPLNSNNMSRSLKIVDLKGMQELKRSDGYLYTFLSEAEGPMLSSMCQKQILVLMHVINSPIYPSHVVRTSTLRPTFSKGDGFLEKLMETTDDPLHGLGTNRELMGLDVGSIPFDVVCDFRDNGGADMNQRVTSVGEILVSPITVRYKMNGNDMRKTYWMVILRTRRCYDFAGHLFSLVVGKDDSKGKRKQMPQVTQNPLFGCIMCSNHFL